MGGFASASASGCRPAGHGILPRRRKAGLGACCPVSCDVSQSTAADLLGPVALSIIGSTIWPAIPEWDPPLPDGLASAAADVMSHRSNSRTGPGARSRLRCLLWLALLASARAGAAPGDILFQDAFDNLASWTVTSSGGDAGTSTQTASSPTRSMYLRNGIVTVTSVVIDAARPGATLTFWVRRGDNSFSDKPPNDDNLVVEFLDNSGAWQLLDTFRGQGTGGEIFTRSHSLPGSALHAGLRLRARTTAGAAGGGGRDYWHVDDVVLTENGAPTPFVLNGCEDFENGFGNWNVTGTGGSAGTSTATAGSPTRSLYTRWGPVYVTSRPLDLSAVVAPTVRVEVWVRRGDDSFSEDPDGGDSLQVQYLDSSNAWVILEAFPGGGPNGETLTRTYFLGAAAMHAGFRLRFRQTSGSGADTDYWHVDDVCIGDTAAPPRAEWRFDQAAWSLPGDVLDSSPFVNHGTAVNTQPVAGRVCNAADLSANSATDYLAGSGAAMHGATDFTIAFWARTSSTANQTAVSVANATRADELQFQLQSSGGSVRLRMRNANIGSYPVPGTADGNWHHFAWTRAGTSHCLYRDGALVLCRSSGSTSAVSASAGGLIIGQDQDSVGGGFSATEDWEGELDEYLIFDRVLTLAEVQAIRTNHLNGLGWDGAPRACPSQLTHFAITAAAVGSTCTAHEVTIAALDAADAVVTTYAGTVALSTSNGGTGRGDWSKLDGGGLPSTDPAQGALTPGAGDSGAATLVFVPGVGAGQDGGSVKLFLANQHAETLRVSVSDPAVPAADSTSDPIVFADNAFVLAITDPGGANAIAGRPHPLRVDMVRRDPVTGSCGVATNYNVPEVSAWITRDGLDPGGAAPALVTASETETLPDLEPGTANLTVPFVAGTANVALATTDVGKLAINLLDDSAAFAAGSISGASSTITVRPFAIAFTNVNAGGTPNPGTTTPAAAAFTAAGSDFAATLGAYRWSAGDDANDDGVPDGGANVTDNGLTAAFAADTVIARSAVAPDAAQLAAGNGELGPLANAGVPAAAWSGGQALAPALRYSEVGSIAFSTAVTAYLGTAGADITGSSAYDGSSGAIGRFRAHHFEIYDALVDAEPVPEAACAAQFSYVDQPIAFANPPTVTLRARGADDDLLHNYHDFTGVGGANWWRLDLATGVNEVSSDAAAVPPIVLTDSIVHAPATGSGVNGEVQLTLSGTLTYADRDAAPYGPIAPFDATPRLDVTAIDADGAAGLKSFNPMTLAQPELRWGRMAVENGYGSELLPVTAPLRTEYWDGTSFVTAADDACTVVALASDLDLANPETAGGAAQPGTATMTLGAGTTAIASGDAHFAAGAAGLTFAAPGTGNTGYVDLTVKLGTALPWLRYDWENADGAGDGPHDGDPSGRVTFGISAGRAPVIYTREPWN